MKKAGTTRPGPPYRSNFPRESLRYTQNAKISLSALWYGQAKTSPSHTQRCAAAPRCKCREHGFTSESHSLLSTPKGHPCQNNQACPNGPRKYSNSQAGRCVLPRKGPDLKPQISLKFERLPWVEASSRQLPLVNEDSFWMQPIS